MMRILKPVVASVTLIAVLGFVATAYAQNDASVPGILAELKSMVTTVIAQLTTVQDSLATLTSSSAQGNTRWTPILQGMTRTDCRVITISNVERTVRAQIWTFARPAFPGGAGFPPAPATPARVVLERTETLAPGGIIELVTNDGYFWCQFTVLDGTRADIRGSIDGWKDALGPSTALAAE